MAASMSLGALAPRPQSIIATQRTVRGSVQTCRVQPTVHPERPIVEQKDASKAELGLMFEPLDAVQPQLSSVNNMNAQTESFARCDYAEELEQAVNEQINVEYNISYLYHSLHSFFARDNVALPGFAKYFDDASTEEREHARKLMYVQSVRGGRVKLLSIGMPEMEYNHSEKGEALYAMELSLSLEKLNFQKLRTLHDVAAAHNDAQMCDYIESNLLQEQAQDVKKAAEYVSQLRRVGKGHGVYHFDLYLRTGVENGTTAVPAL